jgi:mRNA-degrading endonuclease RelE of RelBE toxin-antitoxin system
MTDKIKKFLKKLSQKELKLLEEIILQIENNDTAGLDVKKLKGSKNIFRARKGDIRIIYSKSSKTRILQVSRRNEKTYSDY